MHSPWECVQVHKVFDSSVTRARNLHSVHNLAFAVHTCPGSCNGVTFCQILCTSACLHHSRLRVKKIANISFFPLQQFLMVHQLVQKAAFRRRFKVNGVLVTHHLCIVADCHRPVVLVFAYCHRQEVLVFAYCHRPVVLAFVMIEFAIYLAKTIRCWARGNSNHKKMGFSCGSCLSQ